LHNQLKQSMIGALTSFPSLFIHIYRIRLQGGIYEGD
jgi:hypothetical protein